MSEEQKALEKKALRNYEIYMGLPDGRAKIYQVINTPWGIEGFSEWIPPHERPKWKDTSKRLFPVRAWEDCPLTL